MRDINPDGTVLQEPSATPSRIVLICPSANEPIYHKRAQQLNSILPVHIFSFTRDYYTENCFPADLTYTALEKVENRKYASRLFSILRSVKKIRQMLPDVSNYIYYAMSVDCLLLAQLVGIPCGYYEVVDLRTAEFREYPYAVLERILIRNVSGLVTTSKFFYEEFYRRHNAIASDKVFTIDNKINRRLQHCRPSHRTFGNGPIRIGFVGHVRFRRPLELLVEYAVNHPSRCTVECYGDGAARDVIDSCRAENVHYHGTFLNPEHLPDIYRKIDVNFVVYDTFFVNVRLALPNKLFESAFFGVPILCSQGTALSTVAQEWGIGTGVRIDSYHHFAEDMDVLTHEWLAVCSYHCFRQPTDELVDDGEVVLRRMLRS